MNRIARCALALAILVPLAAPRSAAAADRATWRARFDRLDASINGGAGYAASADSGDLAWSESYLLNAYVSMFQVTGDTAYLDRLVAQADRMLASAADPDGDGFRGWSTFTYSVNLAGNGGFETGSGPDATLPRGWDRWQSTASTAFRDPAAKQTGAFGATLKTDPSRGWQILEAELWNPYARSDPRYVPGKEYRLALAARTNGSAAGGRAEIYDATARAVLATISISDPAWRRYEARFFAPAAGGHVVKVRLYHLDWRVAGGVAQFDDLEVKQRAEFVVHDGMITAPLAEFAATVAGLASLHTRYGAAAQRYADFIERQIFPKWERFWRPIPGGAGTYVFPEDGSSEVPGISLPHNQYLALGRTYLWMWAARGVSAWRDRAVAMGRAFRSKLALREDGKGYVWHYRDALLPGEVVSNRSIEDTSHGNIDIGSVLALNRFSLVFSNNDVELFARTFRDVMWNGSWSAPDVFSHVDGSGDFKFSIYLSEWAGLARAGAGTWSLLEALYERNARWSGWPQHSTMIAITRLLGAWPRLANGGFEAGAALDPTLPASWTRWQSTAATALRDPASALAGGYGATVVTDPSRGWQVLEERLRDYPAATAARFTVAARTEGGAVRGRVEVYDATAGAVLGTAFVSGRSWTTCTVDFTTPAAQGHDLRVRLYHDVWGVAGGVARFDEAALAW
jgi:hypothetical protein